MIRTLPGLLLCLTSVPAAAESSAVASFELDPALPAYLRDKAISQIETALAAAGDRVVHGACKQPTCVRDLGVDLVVVGSIVKPDDNSTITLRIFNGTGQIAEHTEVCELCGDAELLERFGIAVSTVRAKVTKLEAPAPVEPVVVIQPPAPPVRTFEHRRGSLIPGIAFGAVGLAAVGVGVVGLVLDGRGTCSPGDGPVFPDPGAVIRFPDPSDPSTFICREIYKTKTIGMIATGVGVAAIAAGATLVVRAYRGSTVEVSPTTGGASVKATVRW